MNQWLRRLDLRRNRALLLQAALLLVLLASRIMRVSIHS